MKKSLNFQIAVGAIVGLLGGVILRSLGETPRRAPEELFGRAALPPERLIEFPRDILPLGARV